MCRIILAVLYHFTLKRNEVKPAKLGEKSIMNVAAMYASQQL